MRIWQAGNKREAVSQGFPFEMLWALKPAELLEPVFRKGQPLQIGNEVVIVAKDAYGQTGTVEVIRGSRPKQ